MTTNCKNCEVRPLFQHGSDGYVKFCKWNGRYCYYESIWNAYEENCKDYIPIKSLTRIKRIRKKKYRWYLITEFVKTFWREKPRRKEF